MFFKRGDVYCKEIFNFFYFLLEGLLIFAQTKNIENLLLKAICNLIFRESLHLFNFKEPRNRFHHPMYLAG
jgi:hypothetical protein